uniref:Uncharacterized protein n=1 Tax=Hyaloperonospora arabidopsidis (strain Emoy2) TaxID=559515 RepID=M4BSA4_HYAAE
MAVLRIRTAQLTRWMARDQNPTDVALLMGFKGSKITDSERKLWKTYLRDYNIKHGLSPALKTEP